MLLAAFHLRRDRHTERDSFGYTRQLMSKMGQTPLYSPTLGCPIEISVTIKTNIVKMIEMYNRNNDIFVVERLSWMFESSLYPYKARYINVTKKDTSGDMDILFLENMTKIHKSLTGNHVSFSSPIQYHIDSMSKPWHNNHGHKELLYIGNKYRDWIGNFSYSHDNWNDTERFVESFDNGPPQVNAEEYFKNFILPVPPIRDPFTINNSGRPILARNLHFEKPLCRPFDTTPPVEIIINYPDKTLYSPKIDQQTIDTLDQLSLQYSDLSFEYILSGRAFVKCRINYLVSRYRNPISSDFDTDRECRWIILRCWELIYQTFQNDRMFGDIRVTIVTNYGEEALVEFFDYDTNQLFGAVHFDLAMLALCALSLTAGVSPF